jgi:AcrR family transcriptional regulator
MPSPSREQILIAALELFKSRGFSNVSTRDVAEATGMSRSHLYYYFPDWAALRKTAFELFAEDELVRANRELEKLSPIPAIRALLKECLPARRDTAWALWLDVWQAAMHDAKLATTYLALMHSWERSLSNIIDRGCSEGVFTCADSSSTARQLFALASGYTDELLLIPSAKRSEAAFNEVLEVASLLLRAKL